MYKITEHAVLRYIQHSGSIKEYQDYISSIVENGHEVIPKNKIKYSLDHDGTNRYYRKNGMIAVMRDNRVVTILKDLNSALWIRKGGARKTSQRNRFKIRRKTKGGM